MKTTIAILATAILCGCNTTHFSQTKPDGTKTEIDNKRAIWNTEEYELSLPDGSKMKVKKSSTDNEALKAVAAGAVEGAMKAK